MSTPASKRSAIVARIAKTLTIKVDGSDVHVPVGKAENQIHNCIMVSQVRDLVKLNMKRIKEMEQVISPKELKDLVDAVGRLAESSAEIYKDLDGEIDQRNEKPAEKAGDEEVIDVDFSQITHGSNQTNPPTTTESGAGSDAGNEAPEPGSGAPDGS